ncbi:DUF234 domain-containing protein [Actinophytocola sediminis]
MLAVDHPLSTQPGKPARYRVADSNLRLYLAIGRTVQEQARRGRQDAAVRLLRRRWTTWRGRAVEPLIRDAVELAALTGALPWPDTTTVGGWWNRQVNPEVDLIGADDAPVARQIFFAGAVKWLGTPFDSHDLGALQRAATRIPGFQPGQSGLAVVSLSGINDDHDQLGLRWGPQEVLNSWS